MIRINLLPLVERPSKWPINRLLVVVACLLSMFFSAFYSYTVFELWNMEKELQNTRNQYQLLQPTQVLMSTATNKQQLFNNKNNILVGLTKERIPLYGMVQHLTAVTSPQVWFTDIVKSDKGLIQIKGWSTTYPLVAEFMQTLERDQFFSEPVLTNVEKDMTTQVTKFEIVVKARGI